MITHQCPPRKCPVQPNTTLPAAESTPQTLTATMNPVTPPAQADSEVYASICTQIIREQQEIIGTLAVDQAREVTGLLVRIDQPGQLICQITGDPTAVINELIAKYREFFGHAAVEVCREAVAHLVIKLPQTAVPSSLR